MNFARDLFPGVGCRYRKNSLFRRAASDEHVTRGPDRCRAPLPERVLIMNLPDLRMDRPGADHLNAI